MFAVSGFSVAVALPPDSTGDEPVRADVVIHGGRLFDGSHDLQESDLAVRDGRIVAVGTFEVAGSARQIDADGLLVAPGFIDLHTHCDTSGITTSEFRHLLNYLTQGVTTVVTGNCGSGPVDVGEYHRTGEGRGKPSRDLCLTHSRRRS
jgi:N-acyl-D-aspartate/D-glutamate deacylase